MTIKSFTDKNKKKIITWSFIFLALLILWRYNNPDTIIQVGTQSIFGGAGGIGISIGLLLLALGVGLMFIPGTQPIGILFMVGSVVLGIGGGIAAIESLFSSIQGVAIMGVALFVAFLYFK